MSAGPEADLAVDLAIVGGGAAGALVAMQVLATRPGLRIAMIEPRAVLARGVAYSTPRDEHLLNVPAGRMSCDPLRPNDFVAWLHAQPGMAAEQMETCYVARRRYGDYLAERLAEAARRGRLLHLRERAVGCDAEGVVITLDSGRRVVAGACVLATGNAPRGLPLPVPPAVASRVCAAWDSAAITAIPRGDDVVIVGTGLSMVDVVLALHAQGHRGRILALSRRALLPLPHASAGTVDVDIASLAALPLRARVRRLRVLAATVVARGAPWQWLMQGLRPYGTLLWQTLSHEDRARFLRHLARHWDAHRHRIAPEVASTIDRLRASAQLEVVPARLRRIEACAGGIAIEAHGAGLAYRVGRIVNATGIALQFPAPGDPLQNALQRAGLARSGAMGMGLDADDDGAVRDHLGRPSGRLFAIGSLRIGQEWESVAIPELRAQAVRIATRLRAAGGPLALARS
ncbi:MAG: FAD/NAD(P)-binding protein [Pseudomonadota bacterium]|nr:FAD/NAD(P)-binding protein [Pseudomonadota bacterium]